MIKPEHLTKRKMQALQSKNKIFESGVKSFQENGYDNVTIEDICKTAGVSNGLFYNYFDSKDQIIVELFKKMDLDYDEAFNAIPDNIDALEKLLKFCTYTAIRTQSLGKDYLRVLYQSFLAQERCNVYMINEDRPVYKIIKIIIEEGQQSGQIRLDQDSKEIQSIILHCIRGVFYQWALYDGGFDVKLEVEKVISTLIYGLRPAKN